MKLKFLMSLCLAGFAAGAFAQTHQEGVEYYRADQFNNALELLERNYNNPGTDKAVANYYLGLLAIKQKDLAQAKKYFEQGLQINPDYAYNYIGLGSLELKSGNLKAAEDYFKKAEKVNKKDAAVYVAIARAYYESGDNAAVTYAKQIDKAMQTAQKKSNFQEPEIFLLEGDMALDNGDRNEAAAKYEMATTYNPTAADAYVKYSELYTEFNPDYAIAMLQKLLQNNPSSALGQRELAKAYENKKDYQNAVAQYAKYVNNPSHFKADEDKYSFLLFLSGDYQKGYDYATQLLKQNPDNFTAQRYQFFNAAQIPAMSDNMLGLAEALWNKHASDPTKYSFGQIDYNLIFPSFLAAEKYDEATKVVDEAIAKIPNAPLYRKNKAQLLQAQKNYTGAADAYKDYVANNPSATYLDNLNTALQCFNAGVTTRDTDAAAGAAYLNDVATYCQKALETNPEEYYPYYLMGQAKILLAPNTAEAAKAAKEDYENAIKYIDKEKYANDYTAIAKYLGI